MCWATPSLPGAPRSFPIILQSPPCLSLSHSGSCTVATVPLFLLVLFIPSLLPNCSTQDDTPLAIEVQQTSASLTWF